MKVTGLKYHNIRATSHKQFGMMTFYNPHSTSPYLHEQVGLCVLVIYRLWVQMEQVWYEGGEKCEV